MESPPATRPALSVVVMGYRNEASLVAAVRSVVEQRVSESFEVVVVTSGGERSGPLVREAFPEISLFESPTRLLPGAARNAGIRMASGEFVAFLAGDCVAEPGWVAARLRAHRAGRAAVAGAITNAGPERPWAWAALCIYYHDRLPGRPAGDVAWPDPAAHGISFTRSLLDELGPFDETVRIGEDTAMARKLAERGVPVWFEPTVRTAHLGPSGTRALLADLSERGARFVAEQRPPSASESAWPTLLRTECTRFARRLRQVLRASWRYSPGRRREIVLALPWIVAGALALRLGRIRAFRQARRSAPSRGAPSGEGG